MSQEIEVYFPHDGTYLDASIHNYTSRWRFRVAWQHTDIRETIAEKDIPKDEEPLKQMAIRQYEKHN